MTETLTIISDVNPDIAEVPAVLIACGITDFGESASQGEPAIYAHIDHSQHATVVGALNRAGFRIKEGGQR